MRCYGWAVAVRVLLASMLLGAYVYGWGSYGRRAYIEHVAGPFLRVPAASATDPAAVQPHGRRLHLRVGSHSIDLTAPAGVRFLLPALGLLLLAPRRLYWLGLWGGHLTLGLLCLGFLALGLSGLSAGFVLYDFATAYLIDAFSLGVAALAVHWEWSGPDALASPDAA